MTAQGLSQFKDTFCNVLFERHGHLLEREGLMKDAIRLHCGECRIQGFWSLTHTRDTKYLNFIEVQY